MAAPPTGTKRSLEQRDHERRDDRRDRPRDWRDAFIGNDDRSPRDRDRVGERDRGGASYRDSRDSRGDVRDSRSRDHQRDSRDSRDRRSDEYDRRDDRRDERGGRSYRERERGEREREGAGFPQRRHGDPERRHHEHDSHRGSREEGEIESSPRGGSSNRRLSPSNGASPRRHDTQRSPRRFQQVAVPTSSTSSNAKSTSSRPPPPKGIDQLAPADVPEVEIEEDEEDLEKRLEEKRRRRAAIMAQFRVGEGTKLPPPPSPMDPAELGSGANSVATSNGLQTGVNTETGATPLLKALGTKSVIATTAGTPLGNSPTLANTPLGKHFDLEKGNDTGPSNAQGEQDVSAADYDSTVDNDKLRKHDDASNKAAVETPKLPAASAEVDDEWEEVEIEVEEEADDMDMFAAFGDDEPAKKMRKVTVRRRKGASGGDIIEKPKSNVAAVLEVVDNVDDTEGYYRITPGEILDDGRYQITVTLGKGMFSAVVRAKVLKAVGQERRQDVVGKEVAIKLMRSQESMYVAGRKEAQILKLLNDADPEDKKHIVRMERTFDHKGHLAIVTESMSMNLRDVIKRFGKDVGLNMRAVRAYAHQMLLALSLMRKCNIVHADIKPDNILVSENKAVLKVCDLGTAADVSEGDITPYLVSRFYRAPEITLGLPYDTAIDMWAIGCTLFELYTGKILFPGRSNNHMLMLMMEVKGKIPVRLIKKASIKLHFDENNNFMSVETDRITGAETIKTTQVNRATRDLRSRLMPHSSVQAKMREDELKELQAFVDLLDKCLQLDPVRRISPREALLHPFFAGSH